MQAGLDLNWSFLVEAVLRELTCLVLNNAKNKLLKARPDFDLSCLDELIAPEEVKFGPVNEVPPPSKTNSEVIPPTLI